MLHKLHMEPEHLFHRFAYVKNEIPVAGVAHQAGTCRMGADAESSPLDADCRAHELDNLYVVDTSVFPSIGGVNPDGDGEFAARRRPPARAARRTASGRRSGRLTSVPARPPPGEDEGSPRSFPSRPPPRS